MILGVMMMLSISTVTPFCVRVDGLVRPGCRSLVLPHTLRGHFRLENAGGSRVTTLTVDDLRGERSRRRGRML